MRIINIGISFLLFGTGDNHLIRADGKPAYSMVAVMTGTVLNIVLDAIFVPRFGMAGAAWATVADQIAILVQQITMSNILRKYGVPSVYGSDILLALLAKSVCL